MSKPRHKKRQTKSKKIINNISRVFAIVLFISVFILLFNILKMNIIPTKYMIFIWLFVFVCILFIAFLCIPKIKKGIKIVVCILSLIISSVSIYGIVKLQDTMEFFKNIAASEYEVEQYYVLVLSDSSYQKIEDIEGETVAVYPNTSETYEKAVSILDETVSVKETEYDDLLTMSTDFLNGKVDAILISDAHEEAIEESSSSFASKIRILETIEVKTELDNLAKDASVTKEPFNVYISGIDTYGPIATKSRSDVNIVMTINPVTHEIILTSIPRDYYVQLHGTTGLKDKLTHAGVYGINTSIQTIEDLLDIDINYYVRVNFNTLIDVVDVIGGITIDSDTAFTSYTIPECKFKTGANTVNGKCALAFSRERHAYASGDRHRGQNQQQVITKIIEKMTSSKTIISKYSSILSTLEGSFQTNMKTNQIYSLVKMQLDDMPSWTINNVNLDGSGSMTYTYSYPKQKLYVMVPYENTIAEAKKVISAIEAGQKFSEIQ